MKTTFITLIFFSIILLTKASYFTAFYDSDAKQFYVKEGKFVTAKDWVAYAIYEDTVATTGWGKLIITTNEDQSEYNQMYGAGYLEGSLTVPRIWQAWRNFVEVSFPTGVPSGLKSFINTNIDWMNTNIKQNNGKTTPDPIWTHVELILAQLQGITDAYNQNAVQGQELGFFEQFLANCDGDLTELSMKFPDPSKRPTVTNKGKTVSQDSIPPKNVRQQHLTNTHCSALIKWSPDRTELFSGHTTWTQYPDMLRLWKVYNFNIKVQGTTAAKSVSFSGYPSLLASVDDWYVTSAGLSVTETTNGLMNNDLLNEIVPQNLLSWIRSVLANRMAHNGKEWTQFFATYNSGTYNNQWIITDYKEFSPKLSKLKANTVWILEQAPNYCETEDISGIISKQSYWPSYNVPYFPKIYNMTGFSTYTGPDAYLFSYDGNPRAKIFAREQPHVNNLGSFKYLIRFNDWQNDPYSLGNAANSIASRYDLVSANVTDPNFSRQAFGAIDAKVTSHALMKHLQTNAISGPTFYQQPAFEWTDEWKSVPHYGQPKRFAFDWYTFELEL